MIFTGLIVAAAVLMVVTILYTITLLYYLRRAEQRQAQAPLLRATSHALEP
jgi:CHASE1-domain containing sensor protein